MHLLLVDEGDWKYPWGPTHILGKDYELVPIILGQTYSDEEGFGIWCTDQNAERIDHDHPYVLIHTKDLKFHISKIITRYY